jgi:hypothetical protein
MLCVQPTGCHCVDWHVMGKVSVITAAIRLETPIEVAPATHTAEEDVAGPTPKRCCPDHDSWGILFDHLRSEFPYVSPQRILRLLSQANVSMDAYALDVRTTLELAEIVVRHQLAPGPGRQSSQT